MQLLNLIQDHWHYIPFIMLGWNILSRIIFAIAVITPAIRGTIIFIYHMSYVIIIGSYLLIRKLIIAIKKRHSKA